MKAIKLSVVTIILVLALGIEAAAGGVGDTVNNTADKIVHPSWLREASITTGLLISTGSFGFLNGVSEGYKFSQESKKLATSDNYHIWKTGRDVSGIASGWFMYAQVFDSRQSKLIRVRKVLGTLLIKRNFDEWGYKCQRYGTPFDYTESRNEHAIVYFAIRDGALVDMYIGTGPVSGPIVDAACLLVGWWLIR